MMKDNTDNILFEPMKLPCGVVLKNRIIKAAMSDSLGDGTGHPTSEQSVLYRRWAEGGVAAMIIGEVQASHSFAEKPGNLVLNEAAKLDLFRRLAKDGTGDDCRFWIQLGHAGALSYQPTSHPKGPSALDLPELKCEAFTKTEISDVIDEIATTARLARNVGFGGVEIHAAHGFLLSQFLSPLFNRRTDEYGGSIANRSRLLLQVIKAVRSAVGADFPMAVKLNSSDLLKGGLLEADALTVVEALDKSDIDLIDISGGTYFPGAEAASDGAKKGAYFLDFAKRARQVTTKPLMATGGFKTRGEAVAAVKEGSVDFVGIARALALEPELPNLWRACKTDKIDFPRFNELPEGGITAWYTMRLTQIAQRSDTPPPADLNEAIKIYEKRDAERTKIWQNYFQN